MIEKSYWMYAQWGARPETPEALAERFLRTVDAIRPLHPLLDTWDWGNIPELEETEGKEGRYPLTTVRADMARAVERNMNIGEEPEPDPYYGYFMAVHTNATPPNSLVSLTVNAGKGQAKGFGFDAFLQRATFDIGIEPDPSFITFALWRSVMLILAETWEATWAEASPMDIRPYWNGIPVRVAWMNYVSPRFAPLIEPPAIGIVERRPNGGLFLAATDETFLTTNPAHMAAARAIEVALQPLNQIPYPIDDPYQ